MSNQCWIIPAETIMSAEFALLGFLALTFLFACRALIAWCQRQRGHLHNRRVIWDEPASNETVTGVEVSGETQASSLKRVAAKA